jgi:hypothetical protein
VESEAWAALVEVFMGADYPGLRRKSLVRSLFTVPFAGCPLQSGPAMLLV